MVIELFYLCPIILYMKRLHIVILVAIAIAIGSLIAFSSDFSTYETIDSAKQKPGKSVHVIAKMDKQQPLEYDPAKNPNYMAFFAQDSLGARTKVVYRNIKTTPTELQHSERLVLVGKMQGDVFECSDILVKCPSKYKDNKKQLEKEITKGQS